MTRADRADSYLKVLLLAHEALEVDPASLVDAAFQYADLMEARLADQESRDPVEGGTVAPADDLAPLVTIYESADADFTPGRPVELREGPAVMKDVLEAMGVDPGPDEIDGDPRVITFRYPDQGFSIPAGRTYWNHSFDIRAGMVFKITGVPGYFS